MTLLEQTTLILGHLLSVLGVLFALIFFSRIQAENRRPGSMLAWLLGMLFVPYVAIPLYLFFGGRKIRRLARRKPLLQIEDKSGQVSTAEIDEDSLAGLELESVPSTIPDNRVELITDPIEAYNRFIQLIREARHSIHVATFILSNDEVAKRIVEELARKAREGVAVRLMVDALGSFWLRSGTLEPLRAAGGKIGNFMPVFSLQQRASANLRNHRKIFLFDDRIAMIGGRNISNEYMACESHEELWEDLSAVIEGPAVEGLRRVFAADWEFATYESLETEETWVAAPIPGGMPVKMVASGPDVAGDPLVDLVLANLFQARKRVWIVTPYFVPGETLLRTLCVLAQMGCDVRLITPTTCDRRLVSLARRFFLRELHRAGGRIYLHQGRMVHTKLFLIDDEVCSVGSANIDMRSFYLNYEITALFYSREKTDEMAAYCKRLMDESRVYTRKERRRSGVLMEALENLSLLLSPLL